MACAAARSYDLAGPPPLMPASSHSRWLGALAGVALVVTMFAPLLAIHAYGASSIAGGRPAVGEVTVGLAVILRATARRLLRGASTNLMRTTAGALGRTSARAVTRRFVKFTGRVLLGSTVQESIDGEGADLARSRDGAGAQALALGLGFVALCLSFLGVLRVVSPEVVADLRAASELGVLEMVPLAGVPLLAYAAIHRLWARRLGVRVRYRTEIDGLLLQGYFTGAGSFLPLTTDVDYEGDLEAKRGLALRSILSLFALHLVLFWGGDRFGSRHLVFLGSMFLIYCFVYCFPIRPLEGSFVWARSKLQWALLTLPILAAFLIWLPPSFGEIL